jgi:DNA-binding NarL/FixJ family response regulator
MRSGTTSSDVVRVLLADDNGAMLARVAAVLPPVCTVVGSVKDGRSALAAAEQLLPDVIVLDVSMPGLNGIEVAARLRELGSTAAVVFLSVHNEEELIQAAIEAGGLGYVVKTRLASDLGVAVREARAGRAFVSPIR